MLAFSTFVYCDFLGILVVGTTPIAAGYRSRSTESASIGSE